MLKAWEMVNLPPQLAFDKLLKEIEKLEYRVRELEALTYTTKPKERVEDMYPSMKPYSTSDDEPVEDLLKKEYGGGYTHGN